MTEQELKELEKRLDLINTDVYCISDDPHWVDIYHETVIGVNREGVVTVDMDGNFSSWRVGQFFIDRKLVEVIIEKRQKANRERLERERKAQAELQRTLEIERDQISCARHIKKIVSILDSLKQCDSDTDDYLKAYEAMMDAVGVREADEIMRLLGVNRT